MGRFATIDTVPQRDRYSGLLKELRHFDFWLDPQGYFAVVGDWDSWKHDIWAEARGTDGTILYNDGWIKQSRGEIRSNQMECTQRQLDALADYYADLGERFYASSWRVID